MNVAVVILNYNSQSYLDQFLPSVKVNSDGAEIYVIDNASTDNSVEYLKECHPDIKLITNSSNEGFAGGYNQGLQSICADVYVLLNSDVEVTKGWLDAPLALLKKEEQIVAVQPKILALKDKNKFEHAGAAGGFLDRNYFPFCRGRIFQEVEDDRGQYDDEREVFWASGACLFIKARAFHEMNGFDADFFAHMEEIDLCWRLKRQGRSIYFSGKSAVYHVGGGTLNYDNPKKTYLNFRNSLYMIIKNHDQLLFPKLIWRMCLDGMAALIFLSKFQFAHFAAVLKAHFSVYWNFNKFLKKRKSLKVERQGEILGIFQGNITFKKFIGGVRNFNQLNQDQFS